MICCCEAGPIKWIMADIHILFKKLDKNYGVKVQFEPKEMKQTHFVNSIAENLKITHVFLSEFPHFALLLA